MGKEAEIAYIEKLMEARILLVISRTQIDFTQAALRAARDFADDEGSKDHLGYVIENLQKARQIIFNNVEAIRKAQEAALSQLTP